MFIKYRYFFLVCLAALTLGSAGYYFFKISQISSLNQKLRSMQNFCRKEQKKTSLWQQKLQKYQQADPFFLQNTLEKIKLLKEEKKRLQELSQWAVFQNNPEFRKRLDRNFKSLKFKQTRLKKDPQAKIIESEEISRTTEIGTSDAMRLLSLIEEVSIGPYKPSPLSPQLTVQKFALSKTPYNTFELKLTLYKREFL